MGNKVHSDEVKKAALDLLQKRGVTVLDIAKIVHKMQSPYNNGLDMAACIESVEAVLNKREVQHALLVGIELDMLAEKKMLSEPLQRIVESDEGLFGCDETLALGSVLGYGSIAVTTFGYLDKEKVGIIGKLDSRAGEQVHTFLDDLICGIAASASSRLAHRIRDIEENRKKGKEQAG